MVFQKYSYAVFLVFLGRKIYGVVVLGWYDPLSNIIIQFNMHDRLNNLILELTLWIPESPFNCKLYLCWHNAACGITLHPALGLLSIYGGEMVFAVDDADDVVVVSVTVVQVVVVIVVVAVVAIAMIVGDFISP